MKQAEPLEAPGPKARTPACRFGFGADSRHSETTFHAAAPAQNADEDEDADIHNQSNQSFCTLRSAVNPNSADGGGLAQKEEANEHCFEALLNGSSI